MEKFPYTPSPKNVKEFFNAIQGLGIPPKLDLDYLLTIGFKSSNDRYLVGVSKFLEFVDSSGKPTQRWNDFKNKAKAPTIMADAIKMAYADLYGTYPDADKQNDEVLRDYFAPKSGASESVVKLMVQTFKNLCELGGFEAGSVAESVALPASATPKIKDVTQIMTGTRPITININIQLQLPATEDAKIYDSLFNALKKNLFS